MRLETGYDERRARVEIVPLMDVVFLLLVFFIYAMFTMSVHRGVRVELPRGPAPHASGPNLVVTITADDRLEFERRILSLDDLLLEVVPRHRQSGETVLIHGDRAARLGTGVELLARLTAAGVEAVAFQLAPESPDSDSPHPTDAPPP